MGKRRNDLRVGEGKTPESGVREDFGEWEKGDLSEEQTSDLGFVGLAQVESIVATWIDRIKL